MMKASEIKGFIYFNEEYERYIAIPNSLFDKLQTLTASKQLKSQHTAFAFSYIYLQTYLFRHAKYDKVIPTAGQIKEMLGYSATNKTVNYITKRKGLLDDKKITHTSSNFVLIADYEDEYAKLDKNITFTYVSDLYEHEQFRTARKIGLSQSYKVPIFGLYANPNKYFNDNDEPFDGTFYEYCEGLSEPFTLIDFNVFAYMMANEELGVNAFYLYCYLLYKNELFCCGYTATASRLSEETGLTTKSIQRYRDKMRSYNIMSLIHQMDYFVIGLEHGRKASANIIHTYEEFKSEVITYNKQSIIGFKAYQDILRAKDEKYYINKPIIDFPKENLPF